MVCPAIDESLLYGHWFRVRFDRIGPCMASCRRRFVAGEESVVCRHFDSFCRSVRLGVAVVESQMTQKPNKAPEPTTFAVTSRAIERAIEMKPQNPNRDAARAAPAKVVAHL
jgi:hypothetical protein